MQAAWYERQGAARDVLTVGTMPDPEPAAGEVRIRVAASGVNPGDTKKREDAFGYGMPYPRVIPHSDGAGTIDRIGAGVAPARVGERVWCFGAQSYRPFGTAADYVVVPATHAVPLPEGVGFDTGACLGIPAITAHRCVHAAGPVADRVVLVHGGAGAVGGLAVGLARQAGARVIATVRAEADAALARQAGAGHVVVTAGRAAQDIARDILANAPGGVDHVVEVAFDQNIALDEQVLAVGGSVAAYATGVAQPAIPFWLLLFKNVRIDFVGSDDVPLDARLAAAAAVNALLAGGWTGIRIAQRLPLARIADAHAAVDDRQVRGRVVLTLQ
jgi:NADPH2:quinone reductase